MFTNEVFDRLTSVRAYLKKAYIDPDEIEIQNTSNPDEVGLRDTLYGIMESLGDILADINYWNKPVTLEGTLQKNANGRYELNGFEFTSGWGIEVLIPADEYRPAHWVYSSIEADEKDYFLVYDHRRLDGLQARLRR